jgi:hypothetical protein
MQERNHERKGYRQTTQRKGGKRSTGKEKCPPWKFFRRILAEIKRAMQKAKYPQTRMKGSWSNCLRWDQTHVPKKATSRNVHPRGAPMRTSWNKLATKTKGRETVLGW